MKRTKTFALVALNCTLFLTAAPLSADDNADFFREQVAPILERRCVECHNEDKSEGDFSLSTLEALLESEFVEPGDPDSSYLLEQLLGPEPEMPKDRDPLPEAEIALIRQWIESGAVWPEGLVLQEKVAADLDWWSLKRLERPALPELTEEDRSWVRNPIDAFLFARMRSVDLAPSPEADRRTLIRRVTFDLTGLPPTPDEVVQFVNDPDPQAYEKLVDRLLASPRYGERWARHWLDVVHYGDTHGFDKDKVRPHAWPYRDYVIRAFNEDKPYGRFVQEQLAGDVLWPNSSDGIVATGFIAAGPFDFVGQIEVREGTVEKDRVRNLDRDDMVTATMSTFCSLTAHCARCHNHKFDPINTEDYYSLQAVFAGVDRANRPYSVDSETEQRREELVQQRQELENSKREIEAEIARQIGPRMVEVDRRLAELLQREVKTPQPQFGYHSLIEPTQEITKWVQIDLGRSVAIDEIVIVGCHDTYVGIGAGFGFPVRFKIEVCDNAEFNNNVVLIADHSQENFPNPGVTPQFFSAEGREIRYIRVTANKLAHRDGDYIFALAEILAISTEGENAVRVHSDSTILQVTSLDSIEARIRWQRTNLIDGYYYGISENENALVELAELQEERSLLLERGEATPLREELAQLNDAMERNSTESASLSAQRMVYAATNVFSGEGAFQPVPEGRPRAIHVLHRGSVMVPRQEVGPGTVDISPHLASQFVLDNPDDEGSRRAALAQWIVHPENPLTWRSIVNRVWHYHFGRGIVGSPNDFGRMGQEPSHPELLDWLAVEFRDGGDQLQPQSIKSLHRLIVTSAAYRQVSSNDEAKAEIDSGNVYLWRMNRRRLEAEAIRDAVLSVSGKLDLTMGGPGFRVFGFIDDHSPHYLYDEYDPDDTSTHRRTVYRLVVRSVPDPFMETLDCANPSLIVQKRSETITALRALALMNNELMVRMAEHFAFRLEASNESLPERIDAAFQYSFGRDASPEEHEILLPIAQAHGLPAACRIIFNMNEFVFID